MRSGPLVKQAFTNLLSNAVKYHAAARKGVHRGGPGYDGRRIHDFSYAIMARGSTKRYAHKLCRCLPTSPRSAKDSKARAVGLGHSPAHRPKGMAAAYGPKPEVDKGATFFFTLAAGCQGFCERNQICRHR